jgi:hypothetical protein
MWKELMIGAVFALGVLGIISFSSLRCSQIDKDALASCIDKTQKPLECRAALTMRGNQ